MLNELDRRVEALSEFRDKPYGAFRITSVEHAAKTVLTPAIASLLRDHPDISIEVVID